MGPAEVEKRVSTAWKLFVAAVSAGAWMRVLRGRGPKDVKQVYEDMLDGTARPDEGNILSL